MFCQTLILYRPTYFARFKFQIPSSEFIDAIPVMKLQFMSFKAMDYNQSKIFRNIETIMDMLAQAAVGGASKYSKLDLEDLTEYVYQKKYNTPRTY